MQEKYHREELDLSGLTDFIKHYWKTLETGCSERLKGKWFNTLIFSATPSYTVQTNHLGALVNNLSAVKYRQIEERAVEVARYIVENNATVRQAAKAFGISKSTVHAEVTK